MKIHVKGTASARPIKLMGFIRIPVRHRIDEVFEIDLMSRTSRVLDLGPFDAVAKIDGNTLRIDIVLDSLGLVIANSIVSFDLGSSRKVSVSRNVSGVAIDLTVEVV